MNAIVSPTHKDRIVRTGVLTAAVCVFGGWFLYDGYLGYPAANLRETVKSLDPVPASLPAIDEQISNESADAIVAKMDRQRVTRSQITESVGPPGWSGSEGDEIRYFGPAGSLKVTLAGDLVTAAAFEDALYDEAELKWQKLLGFGMLPVGVVLIAFFARVLTDRFVLDNEGLRLRGRPIIPLDAIQQFTTPGGGKNGLVDLWFERDGRCGKVRLDPYVIRDFESIVNRICEVRGLENPIAARRVGQQVDKPTTRKSQ